MTTTFKCSKHSNKQAFYICTHSECHENRLCLLCVPNHSVPHLNRLLALNESFIEEESLFTLVKKNQKISIDLLENIIKSSENSILSKIAEIENTFNVLIQEILQIINEFKNNIISNFKKEFQQETNIDIDRVNQLYKNINQVSLKHDEELMNTVKKIQLLEDQLIPLIFNEMEKIKNNGKNMKNNEIITKNHDFNDNTKHESFKEIEKTHESLKLHDFSEDFNHNKFREMGKNNNFNEDFLMNYDSSNKIIKDIEKIHEIPDYNIKNNFIPINHELERPHEFTKYSNIKKNQKYDAYEITQNSDFREKTHEIAKNNEFLEKFIINTEFTNELLKNLEENLNLKRFFENGIHCLFKQAFDFYLGPLTDDLVITSFHTLKADIFHKFNQVMIEPTGKLTVNPWDGSKGGRLIIVCKRLHIKVNGIIDVSALGYMGGSPCDNSSPNQAYSGESYKGKYMQSDPHEGAGGGGNQDSSYGSTGGGGGGYGSPGENAENNTYENGVREGGKGGLAYGEEEMNIIYMGSGGGGGAPYNTGGQKGRGGNGGGLILIMAEEFINEGKIIANGGNGEDALANTHGSSGGGGSGGSVYIIADLVKKKGEILVQGGNGGVILNTIKTASKGGKGGLGRIKVVEDWKKIRNLNVFGLKFNVSIF